MSTSTYPVLDSFAATAVVDAVGIRSLAHRAR